MGKKYIIEMKENERLYKAKLDAFNGPVIQEIAGAPYTEPDLEQVRKEAFEKGYSTAVAEQECAVREAAEKGYQRGLNDAWAAARKIALDKEDGGLDTVAYCETFGFGNGVRTVLKTFTASEAIEKIREYEQKQEKKDGVWIASETWFVSEANEPSVDTILICSKCGYAIKIKPHETPALNFCPKCGDCKKPKEGKS